MIQLFGQMGLNQFRGVRLNDKASTIAKGNVMVYFFDIERKLKLEYDIQVIDYGFKTS